MIDPKEKLIQKIDMEINEEISHLKTVEEEFGDIVDTVHNFRFYFISNNAANLK